MSSDDRVPRRLGNWWLGDVLGSGFSGAIYRATNVHTNQVVALKVQAVDHSCPTNRYERALYPLLQGGPGMPTLWAAGVEGPWDYLAIDLLGSSLDSLYRKTGNGMMDLRSVCSIAMQVITRLEFMHSRGVLHRDIQLGNCVVGLPPYDKTIYMIDFGFSKRYIDPHTKRHIPDSRAKRDFIGNYWFSSVAVHCRGKVPSRRDDLEAAALMFIHLLTPNGLSWTRNGVPKTDAAHNRLKKEKRLARPEDLCRGMPPEFEEFLRYSRQLKFQDCPDYARWRNEFKELACERGFGGSDEFVWPPPVAEQIMSPRAKRQTPDADVEELLVGLANLKFGDRQILGDRKNVDDAIRQARAQNNSDKDKTLEISSTRRPLPPHHPHTTTKAQKLRTLASRTYSATDNAMLSHIVLDFIDALQTNSSRNLTKEGFAVLDALYKQLADPSVFEVVPVQPLRTTSKTRSTGLVTADPANPTHNKLDVVARLKRQVGSAAGNMALAVMIRDFGSVTDGSAGRTVTKDGFAFLEGLAARLKDLPR